MTEQIGGKKSISFQLWLNPTSAIKSNQHTDDVILATNSINDDGLAVICQTITNWGQIKASSGHYGPFRHIRNPQRPLSQTDSYNYPRNHPHQNHQQHIPTNCIILASPQVYNRLIGHLNNNKRLFESVKPEWFLQRWVHVAGIDQTYTNTQLKQNGVISGNTNKLNNNSKTYVNNQKPNPKTDHDSKSNLIVPTQSSKHYPFYIPLHPAGVGLMIDSAVMGKTVNSSTGKIIKAYGTSTTADSEDEEIKKPFYFSTISEQESLLELSMGPMDILLSYLPVALLDRQNQTILQYSAGCTIHHDSMSKEIYVYLIQKGIARGNYHFVMGGKQMWEDIRIDLQSQNKCGNLITQTECQLIRLNLLEFEFIVQGEKDIKELWWGSVAQWWNNNKAYRVIREKIIEINSPSPTTSIENSRKINRLSQIGGLSIEMILSNRLPYWTEIVLRMVSLQTPSTCLYGWVTRQLINIWPHMIWNK